MYYSACIGPNVFARIGMQIGNGILHLSARFGHKELLEMLYLKYSKKFPFNPLLRNKVRGCGLTLA